MTPSTRGERACQRGFTLTELMVVVGIIAVLSTLAWSSFRSDPRPTDVAGNTANLIREAARKAAAGGTVRADVVQALGVGSYRQQRGKARSRIRIYSSGGAQYVVAERLQERTTAGQADWIVTMQQKVPRNNEIAGWRTTVDLDGGLGPESTLTASDTITLHCFPDGRCGDDSVGPIDARTIYFRDTRSARRARVVIMPLGGSPAIFDAW